MPSSDDGSSLLRFKQKDLIWVCPQVADVMELYIHLGEPCHVCQLLLTVSHGADSSTFPSRVDVRTGRDLDGLKLVVEGACIPQCGNGTNIGIPIPGATSGEDMAVTGAGARLHVQDTTNLPFLYDFEELEGELDFLTRVVDNRNMVVIEEYRLPEVKGGTPMYFDFRRPVASRRVSFRLLGDVASFADDDPQQQGAATADQEDSDLQSRRLPLATGLSLSNRIKLYHYADPYELGKWASLSAV